MLFQPLTGVAEDLVEWAAGDAPRIRLGLPVIDDRTQGGPSPGELVMILARSGVGKTSVACNIARNVQGTPTVFFSLEMAARMLLLRLAAIHTNTPTFVIEQQLRYQHESPSVTKTVSEFPLLSICDNPAMSIKSMGNYLEATEAVWGTSAKVVIVDYLELVKAPFGTGDGLASVDGTARKLKDFARERDAVVIVLHQLSMGSVKSKRAVGGGPLGIDHGHLPVDRLDAKYGGDTASDFTLAAYRPSLDPNLDDDERRSLESVIKIQFLKTRAGSQIDYFGEEYHYDIESLKITSHRKIIRQGQLP